MICLSSSSFGTTKPLNIKLSVEQNTSAPNVAPSYGYVCSSHPQKPSRTYLNIRQIL